MTSLEITERQRSIVLTALHEKALESRRYVSSTHANTKWTPTDTCCGHHFAKYERDLELNLALKEQHLFIKETIKLFENGDE